MEKKVTIYSDTIETEALEQFYAAMALPCVLQGALMPDSHTGYTLPIGAVVKTQSKIFPSFVGYDIGCGMSAIRTNVKNLTEQQLQDLKTLILKKIPLGRDTHKGRMKLKNKYTGMSDIATDVFQHLADKQVGTLGGGNHFIEVGTDKEDYVNIVIHSGSRGVGKKIAEHYMKLAAMEDVDKSRYEAEFRSKNDWESKNPDNFKKAMDEFVYRRTRARVSDVEGAYGFDISSESGKAYIHDMDQALAFALENRETMIYTIVDCIKEVLGTKTVGTSRFINRNHNHAEINEAGEVIHRKGATHAEEGMLGVIPGNMRDGSFIVSGKGNPHSMNSSSHGAGRVLSRRQAKDLLSLEDLRIATQGIVTNHSDENIDEAPDAYKNIFEVMELQSDLVEVLDHIKPILNIKG
jgi:tRNA-splicing ligase RtcB